MKIRNVICEPAGLYRHCGMLRKVRELLLVTNPTWVTLRFDCEESPRELLSVSIDRANVQALVGELQTWLDTPIAARRECGH